MKVRGLSDADAGAGALLGLLVQLAEEAACRRGHRGHLVLLSSLGLLGSLFLLGSLGSLGSLRLPAALSAPCDLQRPPAGDA